MMSENEREIYESLIEELRVAHTNETLVVADVVVLLQSRSETLKELARVRKQLASIMRERDNARAELRRVCAGAGFKVPEGVMS